MCLTMLCLSGFNLYSRWVPLNNNHRDYEIEEPFWRPFFMLSWLHSISHVMKWPNSWNSDMMIHRTPKRYPVISLRFKYIIQRAKKVVSDSTGLVDIAIGLVNSVLNLPDGQGKFFWNSNYRRTVNQVCSSIPFWG